MFLPMFVVPVVSLMTQPLPKELVDAAFGESETKAEVLPAVELK
jgi:hypothetical protein